ncbi:MAG: elongation factor Ts [Clostridia bacterium]|nr:elongation factor Ts [Clostridia bacterium]
MAITAKQVADLRAKTGLGMMECKKALTEANGNEEEAIKLLREKGLAVAAKKASRIAAEGAVDIMISEDGKTAAMIEVNIETDFAATNAVFVGFVKDLLKIILEKRPADVAALLALPFDSELTVEGAVKNKVFEIGENINIRRFVIVDGNVASYVHGKGQIGVIVNMKDSDAAAKDEFKAAAKNVALQIAAMSPAYLDEASVPASVVEGEKEVILAQIKNDEANAKKPESVLEKMVIGKIKKFYTQNCLLLQEYVKDDGVTVEKYLAGVAAELGASVEVASFIRFEKGEGLEKREDDFADEIAKLTGKA